MLEIKLDDSAFRADLATLYRRLGNLTPVMQSIGVEMKSRISGRFEARTDPNGNGWPAWAPATLARYPKGGNRQLLDRYGDMLLSLNHTADATSARIGFGKPYATFHEFGTKRMPRRGLMFADPNAGTLAPSDETAVLDILSLWLAGPD